MSSGGRSAARSRALADRVECSELGVPGICSHSFRTSLRTLIDDSGLSARVGADHLGHASVDGRRPLDDPRPGARHGERLDNALFTADPAAINNRLTMADQDQRPENNPLPAPPAGIEPATDRLEGGCSIH
jgi:hypothetical protein